MELTQQEVEETKVSETVDTTAAELRLKDVVINRLDMKLGKMREELLQCLKDFQMWQTAHGSDYPVRRSQEIRAKLEEIEKI